MEGHRGGKLPDGSFPRPPGPTSQGRKSPGLLLFVVIIIIVVIIWLDNLALDEFID